MKKYAVIWFLVLLPAGFVGSTPIRIMPLGDSITKGYYGGVVVYDGYRKELKTLLDANGYNTDFVGSQTDGSFADNQHEGHNGWHAFDPTTTNDIHGYIDEWMADSAPEIVLLHIGTNDIYDEANADEVADILDKIFAANSNATVVLALIINAGTSYNHPTFHADVSSFNSNLNTMAQIRIANGDDMIVVDMEYGAGLDYATMPGTHPSQLGYDKMATNWFPAVQQAITNQLAKSWSQPLIHSIMRSGSNVDLGITNLTVGIPMDVQQTAELVPPAWSNIGSFTPANTQTNWNAPADSEQAFFRVVIP